MKTIHLYRVDKNRQARGYQRNYNLIIDYAKKTFRTYINPFYWYTGRDDIEVNKKSDILDYEKLLVNNGFIQIESF